MEVVTLDQSRFIQIPQNILEQLGVEHEGQFSLEVQDGKLVLNPIKEDPETLETILIAGLDSGAPEPITEDWWEEKKAKLVKKLP